MTSPLLFELAQPTMAVAGTSSLFPVRRIYCVGRNYLDHIREMGGDEREAPFFFQKPSDAIVEDGAEIAYPIFTKDFQYEVELVLAIGREGEGIPCGRAHEHVVATAVGIDLTRRDVQVQARKMGRPWEVGKAFDRSAPCGHLVPLSHAKLPERGKIELMVNGEVRQSGDIGQMIWSAAEIISNLSEQYRLMPGDLIFTGTPAGVGPIHSGDQLVGVVEGSGSVCVTVR